MTDTNQVKGRWCKPVITSLVLPTHAQTSSPILPLIPGDWADGAARYMGLPMATTDNPNQLENRLTMESNT